MIPSRFVSLGTLAALLVTACGDDGETPRSPLVVQILSSRADSVTGGDALIEIGVHAGADATGMVVEAGGRDVTSAFSLTADNFHVGVVEGLPLGDSAITATVPGHLPARLAVTTYPITGPVISGPHQMPFQCRTEEAGLGTPTDDACSVETRYEHFYKNTAGTFVPIAAPTLVGADAALVKRGDGTMIPYVVRVERGTINRAIYQITVLFDPREPTWTATSPQPQWNRKVIYSFKGGCGEGHHQGLLRATDDLLTGLYPLADAGVGAGFAIVSASLNTLGTTCNDVVSAETAMMVKERFIERYGVPLYTTGWGGSGGSIQQHLIAENYPGILDGIVPMISYPDIVSVYPDVMDCPLFTDYFAQHGATLSDAAKTAMTGYATFATCQFWAGLLGHLEDPTTGCDAALPASSIYHPTTNPTGARCSFVDNMKNLVGVDPATGFARRIFDNVGVQYGLAALNAGQITTEQFLHLNENIGGFGVDGVRPAPRSAADLEGLRAVYEGGRVIRGDRGLSTVPIVDLRYYTDLGGDIHDRVRSFTTRARLTRANGHADNQLMVMTPTDGGAFARGALGAVIIMDIWLTALVADQRADRAEAVVATRPAGFTDLCVQPGVDPVPGTCLTELPVHRSPRLVAGAPEENDILKCELVPLDASRYTVSFTAGEWARLQAIFPAGVCDYGRPGVGQVAPSETWRSFGPRP